MKTLFVSLFLFAGALVQPFAGSTILQEPEPGAAMPPPTRQKVTTFLWYDQNAEEAVRFYCSIFDDSKVLEEARWGEGGPVPKGTLMTARFRLAGQEFLALNAGPHDAFNDSISLFVDCADQKEIDRYWDALLAGGGKPVQCGWLQDKYGLRWQIVPRQLIGWLANKDAGIAQRVSAAMMKMQKLDLAKLEAAAKGR
jgi:two-component system sensor histidine kinase QseC